MKIILVIKYVKNLYKYAFIVKESLKVLIVDLTIVRSGLDLFHSSALRATAWAGLRHNMFRRLAACVELTLVILVNEPDPHWVVFLDRQQGSGPAEACVPPPAFSSPAEDDRSADPV